MSLGRGRRRRTDRGDLRTNAEINVTSLIDVAFTLLVIFIITAPVLQGGVQIDLPRADTGPLEPNEDPFTVSILPSGVVMVGETEIEAEEFEEVFPQLFELAQPSIVDVRGDSAATYGRVAPVLVVVSRAAQDAGTRFRLIIEDTR